MSEKKPEAALNLDIDQQQSFVRFFRQLPEKPQSTVRIFNRIEYYTVHEEDAILAAKFAPKVIKYMGNEPKLSYVCLSKHQMEQFTRELLLVCQYRIEVYSKPPGRNNNDWIIEFKGSPGNLSQFEDILFENVNIDFSNSVMGVKILKNNVLAIANANLTDLRFEVCEITDNDCFTELEALIAQVGPKECVIPSGDSPELTTLTTLLERNGVLVNKVKKSDFAAKDIKQDLNRLLFFHKNQPRSAETLLETNMEDCMSCLQAVIKFLSLTNSENNFNQYKLGKLDINRFVRLDFAALNALNIVPKSGKDMSGFGSNVPKSHSISGILNHCVTAQGKRLLSQWIKQPLKDHNLINERLDIVECLVKDSATRITISKDALTKVPDLMMLSKKLSGKKAKLQDCYKVYQAINRLPHLVSILRKLDNKCVSAVFVDPLGDQMSDMQKFQAMIETLLDLDLVDKGEFLIKNTVNEEINELYENKGRIEKSMQKVLKRAAEDLGLDEGKSIKLESNPQWGHFFRITKKEEQVLRKNKNFEVLDTVAGGVRFRNKKLKDLSDDYDTINKKYEESQKDIADEILSVAMGYTDTIRIINVLLAHLDVLVSFATAAVSGRMPYVRPKIKPLGSGVLKLEQIRHPCLEQQDHIAFIPNDASFDESEKIFHIITGPNMCGKSTYIRSIGVCVLMAQIGSFVPCGSAEISLVDAILARVGADDCQLKGLSTFMLEMIEAATILKTATKNSLVIVDELGRGTSTYDGCGIAWAIAEHLATEIKCFSLFATHFHKITKLADMYASVGNLHVSAVTSENNITPLYTVKEGECDKSYGIHCAKLAEFPRDVIEESERELKFLEHHEGLKYLKSCDVSSRKRAIEEGDKIIEDVLQKLARHAKNMTDGELKQFIGSAKKELMGCDNLFVKGLLE